MSIRRFALLLLAGPLLQVGCASGSDDHSSMQLGCIEFSSASLVGGQEGQPIVEWSANDDVDSVAVAITGSASARQGVLEVEAGKRPLRLADDVPDTTVTFVKMGEFVVPEAPSEPIGRQHRIVHVIRPSALDSAAGVSGDERVVRVRGRFVVEGQTRCAGELRILPAM